MNLVFTTHKGFVIEAPVAPAVADAIICVDQSTPSGSPNIDMNKRISKINRANELSNLFLMIIQL